MVDVFDALAHPVRRALLERLRGGVRPAGELGQDLPITREAVSRHLRLMAESGLLVVESRGRQRWYSINPSALAAVAEWLQGYSAFWTQRLDALDVEVARGRRGRSDAEVVRTPLQPGPVTPTPVPSSPTRSSPTRSSPTRSSNEEPDMTDLFATILRQDQGSTITLRRLLRTDASDLWAAITVPERAVRWLGAPTGNLIEGGSYRLVFDDADPDASVEGTIRSCVPERELVVTWRAPGESESVVHVRLVPTTGGTDLELVHSHLRAPASDTGHAAGWQVHVQQLANGLERGDWTDQWHRWADLERTCAAAVAQR